MAGRIQPDDVPAVVNAFRCWRDGIDLAIRLAAVANRRNVDPVAATGEAGERQPLAVGAPPRLTRDNRCVETRDSCFAPTSQSQDPKDGVVNVLVEFDERQLLDPRGQRSRRSPLQLSDT